MAGNQPIAKNTNKETSTNTHTVVTIILLLFTFIIPLVGVIGVFVMWFSTTWKKWVKILITILIALPFAFVIIFLVTYIFIVRPFQVSGDAMFPNYRNGEYMLTSIYHANITALNSGDIIIFVSPPDPNKDFIKRVIGLPGDTIELVDGYVSINGKRLDESSYLNKDVRTYGGAFLKDGQPFTIPDGNYFVLGDNRPFSSDSREWGLVPKNLIISKVDFCYWNCK